MNKLAMCKMFLNAPNTYREAVISDHSVHVLDLIGDCEMPTVDSKWLSEVTGKSIQNASALLAKLWKKGYLNRSESIDSTGGIVYRYSRSFE